MTSTVTRTKFPVCWEIGMGKLMTIFVCFHFFAMLLEREHFFWAFWWHKSSDSVQDNCAEVIARSNVSFVSVSGQQRQWKSDQHRTPSQKKRRIIRHSIFHYFVSLSLIKKSHSGKSHQRLPSSKWRRTQMKIKYPFWINRKFNFSFGFGRSQHILLLRSMFVRLKE